ncbi:MAG: hydroxymethylbilane synthase [Nitrospirota bacterium]
MLERIIKIGTRGSTLALWQAEWVRSRLEEYHKGIKISLIRIKTTGDKILDVPLSRVGGKGLFVKEIEEGLLRGDIDVAVHSMKDIPAELPEGLYIGAITEREDPRDALIIRGQGSRVRGKKSNPPIPPFTKGGRGGINNSLLYDLPQGARVGTSSLRRQCQLKAIRPDFNIINLRGNLDTRIRKLEEGNFDAIIVASAGVRRLGLEDRITEYLLPEISLPAIGQGALGIEARINDAYTGELVSFLNHERTSLCVKAERAFLRRLEGGCQFPIAAYARIRSQESGLNSKLKTQNARLLLMDGLIGSVSGDRIIRGHIEGSSGESEAMGIKLAEDLLSRGGCEILTLKGLGDNLDSTHR